ncbi:neurotrophin receptor-interacting factor homolog [Drosophila obscura]|uniref:neurotrophin receptor-interacting factor homolog n=1 Tax=Drosophila obscura TaxID=7282 RepID=UPI000BA14153|nr:neurotrophin receptor-interacting factor homolog [Drosophila obscura]
MANNLESRVVDLDVACLICLNEESGHISIYSHDLEPPHTLIADMIRCCTSLQLESLQMQRWPDKICEQCHSELAVAYRFYEKCLLIEKLFLTATNSALLVDVDELAKNQQLKLDLEQHHVKLPSSLKIKRVEVDADIPLASRTVVCSVSAAPRAITVQTTGSGSILPTSAATTTAAPILPVTKFEYFQEDGEDTDSLGLLPDTADSLVMSLDTLIETVPIKEQPEDEMSSDEEDKKRTVPQTWDENPPSPEHAYEIETILTKKTQGGPQTELPQPPRTSSRALNTIQRCNISKRTYKRVTPIFKREVDDGYVLFDSQQIGIPETRRHAERARKICHVCGNTYKYQHALNAHMRRHNNDRPYPCEVCQKAFISNVELRRHMRVHTGQKPYGCRYCDRRFSDFGSSKKHERIHTGERPYVCEVCHKGFAYAHVLTVHRRTHTGKKQFQCTQCDKGFTKKNYLAAHLDQHNGVTTSAPAAKRPAARKLQKRHVPEALFIGQLMLGTEPPKVLEECIVTHDFMFNEEDEADADDHDLEAAGEKREMELDDPEPEHDDFDDVDVYHHSVRSVKDDPYALVGDLLDSEEFADDSKYLID